MKKLLLSAGFLCIGLIAFAQSERLWSPINENQITLSGARELVPQKYLTYQVNIADLRNKLLTAPSESQIHITNSNCIIYLPMPNGQLGAFRVVEAP